MEWARIGNETNMKAIEWDWMSCHDFSLKIGHPPWHPLTTTLYWKLLFVMKMEMYVYQTLQALKIYCIATGYRDMNIQPLFLSRVTLGFTPDLISCLASPSLVDGLVSSLITFSIPPSLGLLDNPLNITYSGTGLPLFFKHFFPSYHLGLWGPNFFHFPWQNTEHVWNFFFFVASLISCITLQPLTYDQSVP